MPDDIHKTSTIKYDIHKTSTIKCRDPAQLQMLEITPVRPVWAHRPLSSNVTVPNADTVRIPFFRSGPFTLIYSDLLLVIEWARYIPYILSPYVVPDAGKWAELAIWTWPNFFALLSQVILLVASFTIIAGAGWALWFTPTFVFIGWLVVCGIILNFYLWITQSKKLIYSSLEKANGGSDGYADETWLYVNGIATGNSWCQSNVDLLASLFKRNVIGIHNESQGIFFDFLQSLIQREVMYPTQDASPNLYGLARAALLNPDKKKVVMIAHSQGGIILSLVIDALISDLEHKYLEKLEIYTFASASNHFNIPLNDKNRPVFAVVEHFANEKDFFACLGVLNWYPPADALNPGTQGKLYRREATGHLLNMHYFGQGPPNVDWPDAHLWTYLASPASFPLQTPPPSSVWWWPFG